MASSNQGVTAGLRGQYDIALAGGVIAPTLRAEFRRAYGGDAVQNVSYASDASSSYALAVLSPKRDTVTGALGLKAISGATTGMIEYAGSFSPGGGYVGHGLRGTLRMGF